MADFLLADAKVDRNEGFYGNHKNDSGKETIWGIARAKNPQWEGWQIVDKYRDHKDFPNILKNNATLHKLCQSFYRKTFWNVLRGDEILDQEQASKLYDTAVNMGCPPAVKILQEAIGVEPTGKMDDATLSKLNSREATA